MKHSTMKATPRNLQRSAIALAVMAALGGGTVDALAAPASTLSRVATTANVAANATDTQTATQATTTANVVAVAGTNAVTTVTVGSAPAADSTLTLGSCVVTFKAGVTGPYVSQDSVACGSNAATIDLTTDGTVARTQAELAAILRTLTSVDGGTHGALTITGSGADAVFTSANKVAGNPAVTPPAGITSANTTPGIATVVAVAQIDTITIGGTIEAGDVFSATLPGSVTASHTAGTAALDVAAGLNTAIQSSAGYAAQAFTSSVDANVITLTAKAAGTGFAVTSTATNQAAVAQIDTFTPASVTAGERFRITVGGTNYDYVAQTGDTATLVANGLRAAIANAAVTENADGNGTVVLTAATPGTGFSATSSVLSNLAYSATTLTEMGGNYGSVSISMSVPGPTLTLTGDTFAGANGDDFVAAGKVTVSNVPAGLTAVVYRTSSTTVTLYFNGSATSHAAANSITNLTVTFADTAFTGGSAATVGNSTKNDLHIDFYDSDTSAPTVSTYSPADDATGVSTTGTLALTFNESVTAVSGKNIYIKSGGTTVETIAANDTTKVSGSKGGTVYINPTTVLTASTAYNVEIDAGAFVDINATPNAYAGISDAATWNFTTGAADTAAPTISSVSPTDNSTGNNPAGDLSITFSEYVQAGTGNIVIKTVTGDTVVETIAANDTSKVSISKPTTGGSKATINPSTTLALNTAYYVEIDNTAFKDKANNDYAGMTGNSTWNFETNTTDTFVPYLRTVTLGAPTSSSISVSGKINEGATAYYVVMPAAATWPTAAEVAAGTGFGGGAATVAGSVAMTAETATAINITGLAPSTSYYLYLTAKDSANNLITFGSGAQAYYYPFTTAAAPAPAPSGDSGSYTPPAPATTTVAPGGTTTIGTSTTPVEAGEGSTLNVTEGTSGATINLPTPPATGATTPSAVNVVIGGNTLSVKPTESGSVVKTATVTVNGASTTVLNVTAGTAQVTASAANQPLVSVGTGANAVVISSGSASATVITSVDKATGVTSLTLPKSTTVSDADASIKMTIGGQDVNVKPQGGADVVVTLTTVTVGGQNVQVVSVTGGSAMVTSSQPNQPLLAIGSGSGAIVVTGGNAGSEATSKVDSATGNTTLSITSGTITLPSNAFAEAGTNGFAAIKDGKLYAGEIAVFNSAGKITGVRLGSQSGGAANVGDPITAASTAGLTSKVAVPNLKGKVARVSDSQDFGDVIAASLGATSKGQNSNGVLSLNVSGVNVNAMPIGDITVDTSRADGMTATGNGNVEVAKSGVIASFVPAVADPAQLVSQAIALDKNAGVTVNEYGVLQATVNGITYALQPSWVVSQASAGTAGFTMDARGRFIFQDATGNQQTLYPAFADLAQLVAAFKGSDANLSATGNDDGTVTAKLLGKTYTLTPDYALIPVPAEHAKDAWWVDGSGKVFIKNGDGKTAQGFAVK